MGSDTELESEVSLKKLLAEFISLRNASRHEISMLKEENSAFNALKEENSALKTKNEELEENFEMKCSSQAYLLNKNVKGKIKDKEACALAYRNLEAESNGKILRYMNRIEKLEAENFDILAKKYEFVTRCSRLQQNKKNDLVRIK